MTPRVCRGDLTCVVCTVRCTLTVPMHITQLGYIFYGTHKLDERCRQFFDEMEARLVRDAVFRVLQSEDELICARDGLEQYVLHRIGQHAYKLTETVDEDRQLMRRMQILSTFITPEHLEIPPAFFHEEMLRQAGRELKAINNFRTPGDKVACIVSCPCFCFPVGVFVVTPLTARVYVM